MTTVREIFGIACPQCGSDADLKIEITTWVDVSPDGTIDNGYADHEWDDRSRCFCSACGLSGLVSLFAVRKGRVR
jgi:hypothetical protein